VWWDQKRKKKCAKIKMKKQIATDIAKCWINYYVVMAGASLHKSI
jgi:hypothetical protein